MKIVVMMRSGERREIELLNPVTIHDCEVEGVTMSHLHNGDGFDHYFYKSDGMYDGSGSAVTSPEHAALLQSAMRLACIATTKASSMRAVVRTGVSNETVLCRKNHRDYFGEAR